eukprot:488827-Amphidinium_carterae.1
MHAECEFLATRLKELWTWMARQEAFFARGDCFDCEEVYQTSKAGVRVGVGSAPIAASRRKRAFWQPPEWLVLLAQQATPVQQQRHTGGSEGPVGVRVESAFTLRVLSELSWTHQLCLHKVVEDSGTVIGQLITCGSCGAYAHVRRGWLHKECQGHPFTPSLRRQKHRVQIWLHPSALP